MPVSQPQPEPNAHAQVYTDETRTHVAARLHGLRQQVCGV